MCQAHIESRGSAVVAIQDDLEAVIEDEMDGTIHGFVRYTFHSVFTIEGLVQATFEVIN